MNINKNDWHDLIHGDREVIYIDDTFRINHLKNKSFSDFLKLFGVNHYTPEIGVIKNGNKFDYFFLSRQKPTDSTPEENLDFLRNNMNWFKQLIAENVDGVEFVESTYDIRKPAPFGETGTASSKKKAFELIEEEKSFFKGKTFFRAYNGAKHFVCICDPNHVERVSSVFDKFNIDYSIV